MLMEETPWIAFLIAVSAVGISLYYSFYKFRKARVIEDIPTALIRSASQGYVELFGKSKPDQRKLKSPLTAQPCLWYEYKVEKHVRTSKRSYWKTIESGSSDFSFYLDDDTGKVHVHPEGAYVVPDTRQVWYGSSSVPNTAPGVASSIFSMHRYRYTESRIHEGQSIYALGWYQTLATPSASEQARDHMAELLSAWKLDKPRLLSRFDTNKDGKIDQDEWQVARAEAAKEARSYISKHYDDRKVNTLSKPEQKSQVFILSTKSPERVVRSFKIHGWVSLVIFIISLAALGYLISGLL